MKKICILFFCVICCFSCSNDDEPQLSTDIYLVESVYMGLIPKSFIELAFSQAASVGTITQEDYEKFAPKLKSNIKAYKITYYTTYQSAKTKVSGIYLIPENPLAENPTIIYAHGTISDKTEAPSVVVEGSAINYTLEVFLGFALASISGSPVLMPDYLGYGKSVQVTHPYIHAESLGQTCLDFIRSYKEFAGKEENNIVFNNKIFVTGYSEGGYAAVALCKKMQETNNSGFTVEKTVAGSGAYDHVAFAKEFLAKNTEQDMHMVSSYLWVLDMYKNEYGYSRTYPAIFSAEDNVLLQAGGYDFGYFVPEKLDINTNPELLFLPDFIEDVQLDRDTEFLHILSENSLCSFVLGDSIIFVQGDADTWVYPSNTENAYNYMKANGGKVKKYIKEGGDHYTTLSLYLDVLVSRLN